MTGSTREAATRGVGGGPRPEPLRHGRQKRYGAWSTFAKLLSSALAVVLVAGAGIGAYVVSDLLGDLREQPAVSLGNEEQLAAVPDIGAMEGGLNFLLLGSDKRPPDGAFGDPDEDSGILNDVTMLLHISQDHSHVEVVSFPRDLIVPVPECDDPEAPGETLSALSGVKINTVLNYGGMPCVVRTVSALTGVDIPVAGVVEFYGVAGLSDAVGGVDVCVAEQIDDDNTGIHLTPGVHTLQGIDALQFLRTRHGVGDGSDLGRISNQQIYLASLMRTMEQKGTLGDPIALYNIAKTVLANMTLSTGLQNPLTLVSIARALQDIELGKIAFIQYPNHYNDDSSAVLPSDSAEAVNLALQQDVPVQLDPTAQDSSQFGTVADPNAPVEAAPPEEGDATGEVPTDPAPPGTPPAEALPSDVLGQTAAESRCSVANWD